MKVVGIDAGGSKTRTLFGENEEFESGATGSILEELLGPGNFRQIGIEGVRELARDIVRRFEIDDPTTVALVGGFAGAGSLESLLSIEDAFEEIGFTRGNLTVSSDAGLLLSALGGSGIVLIAGTGSICVGTLGEKGSQEVSAEVRAGGYGYRLARGAGGYDLGIRAIDAALRVEDGREQEDTLLCEAIKDCFELENLRQIDRVLYPEAEADQSVEERVSSLASVVLSVAHDGDTVATAFVEELVDELADCLRTVHRGLGGKTSLVGLHGGLFSDRHGEELLTDRLRKHPCLESLGLKCETLGIKDDDRDPLIEAIRAALRQYGD